MMSNLPASQELTHNRTAPGKEGELIETILAFLAIFNL